MNIKLSALHALPSVAADAPGPYPSRAGGNHRTEAERHANFSAWLKREHEATRTLLRSAATDPAGTALRVALDVERAITAARAVLAQDGAA